MRPLISSRSGKLVAIVESDHHEQKQATAPKDDPFKALATQLIKFMKHELAQDKLSKSLLPIKIGIGKFANAVVGRLTHGYTLDVLIVGTDVLPNSFFDLFGGAQLDLATTTSIRILPNKSGDSIMAD